MIKNAVCLNTYRTQGGEQRVKCRSKGYWRETKKQTALSRFWTQIVETIFLQQTLRYPHFLDVISKKAWLLNIQKSGTGVSPSDKNFFSWREFLIICKRYNQRILNPADKFDLVYLLNGISTLDG